MNEADNNLSSERSRQPVHVSCKFHYRPTRGLLEVVDDVPVENVDGVSAVKEDQDLGVRVMHFLCDR